VLLADGGSGAATRQAVAPFLSEPHIRFEHHPGSVAETRNSALRSLAGRAQADAPGGPARARTFEEAVVFLDSDETAPRPWLATLLAPLEGRAADIAGGPTHPHGLPRSYTERYVNEFDAWFYENVVARDPTTLPMGNTAWRLSTLLEVGGFDPRLTMGGEDWDINLRARNAGARFAFVPDAWVFHDQAHLGGIRKLLRRKYRYSVGASVAYLKNGALGKKAGQAARTSALYPHPLEWVNLALKPAAFLEGWWIWQRRIRKPP
jgi:GT2 family glycosyltransferase